MTLRVKLFARARDLAGTSELAVELPAGATVADLRAALALQRPALTGLLPRCVFAVDNEFAADETPLSAEREVALLPPVSGG